MSLMYISRISGGEHCVQNMIGETASIECVLTLFSTPPKKIGHCCEKLNTITSSPKTNGQIRQNFIPSHSEQGLLLPLSLTANYTV